MTSASLQPAELAVIRDLSHVVAFSSSAPLAYERALLAKHVDALLSELAAAEARAVRAETERDAVREENESFNNPERTVTHEYHLRVIEPLVAARKSAESIADRAVAVVEAARKSAESIADRAVAVVEAARKHPSQGFELRAALYLFDAGQEGKPE